MCLPAWQTRVFFWIALLHSFARCDARRLLSLFITVHDDAPVLLSAGWFGQGQTKSHYYVRSLVPSLPVLQPLVVYKRLLHFRLSLSPKPQTNNRGSGKLPLNGKKPQTGPGSHGGTFLLVAGWVKEEGEGRYGVRKDRWSIHPNASFPVCYPEYTDLRLRWVSGARGQPQSLSLPPIRWEENNQHPPVFALR